jgi:RHS repeat-associated protein
VLQAAPRNGAGELLPTIDAGTGVITWNPTPGNAGVHDFAVLAEDGNGGIDVQSFTLRVTVPNRAPTAVDDTYTAVLGSSLTVGSSEGVLVNDTDPDGDDLDAALISSPSNGRVELDGDGSFTYTPRVPDSSDLAVDAELTHILPVTVTSDAPTNPAYPIARLTDGYVEQDWFTTSAAAFDEGDALRFSFDLDVAVRRVDLFGARQFGEQGYDVKRVEISVLDAVGNTLLGPVPFTMPVDTPPNDGADPDGSFDLTDANGGEPVEGARTVVIAMVQVGGRNYPGLTEVDIWGDAVPQINDPRLKWVAGDRNGVHAPAVGDLDRDGVAEIVAVRYSNWIEARDGATGELRWERRDADPISQTPAIGDVVGCDWVGAPPECEPEHLEVVYVGAPSSWIRIVDAFGNLIAELNSDLVKSEDPLVLADVDGDGDVEVIGGNTRLDVYDIDSTSGELTFRYRTIPSSSCGNNSYRTCIPVVVDIDVDGELEIVTGNHVFDAATGAVEQQGRGLSDAFVGVANFDDDPEGEIVRVSNGTVHIVNHDFTTVWGPVPLTTRPIPGSTNNYNAGAGGPPTIGDFDGDGRPEIGVAGAVTYSVYDPDIDLPASPVAGDGSIWSAPTVDGSSSRTGSTLFDFDGDGSPEVVYGSEQNLWIYDGPTGEVVWSRPISSSTTIEAPIVADVDGDGQAELVFDVENGRTVGGVLHPRGISVYESPSDDWVRARAIWNQHAYSVTNVNADGSIPRVPSVNWLDGALNNFRQQSFGSDDITALDTFTYEVSDPAGATSDATVFVESRPPQNDPVVTCLPQATATVGYDYRSRVCATDPDGDQLSFSGAANLATTVEVPSNAHPWLAGQPEGAAIAGDDAPDDSPILAATADFFAPGEALTFVSSGNVAPSSTRFGPSGATFTTYFGPRLGMSGLRTPQAALVGVFLGDGTPDPAATPPDLDFSSAGLGEDFLSLSPLLQQPFLIGDGRTTSGVVQEFVVPVGATRLFVGVMDNSTWAANAGDGFQVTVISPRDAGIAVDQASGALRWTPPTTGVYRLVGTVTDDSIEERSTPFTQTITVEEPVRVPDVVGLTEVDARQDIVDAGLLVGTIDSRSSVTVPAGEVLEQFPPAGSTAARETRVLATVSSGPSPADTDGDDDGFTPNQGDCDDTDPAINPGAEEIDNDGVDSDCDGEDGGLDVSQVGITGADSDLAVGRTRSFTVQALLRDGRVVDITELATFGTTDATIARVDGRTATAVAAGPFGVTASFSGLTATKNLTAFVAEVADEIPPVADIASPAPGAEISAEVDIVGTATDANLVGWTLSAEIAEGTDPVEAGLLGTMAAASVPAGVVSLRLDVEDRGGNVSRTQVPVRVLAGAQPGQFSLTFTDLTVPLSGIPISVIRTYDSRDRRPGDFGAGWDLDLTGVDLRMSPNQGDGWELVSGRFGSSVLQPTTEHSVTITLPGGEEEIFDLVPSPRSSLFVPLSFTSAAYSPRFGTSGTLTPAGNRNLLVIEDATDVRLVDDTTLRPYSPQRFVYTTVDGTAFTLTAGGDVTRIVDPNGNVMTIDDDGITHSAGASVEFARDAFGRITSVTDPAGNVQTYRYSAAGDLIAHTDAEGAVTTFRYTGDHRLTDVIDPLGRPIERREYDDQGRLAAIISAGGERTTFTYDIAGQTQVVTDADGNETTFVYDLVGNIVSVTDPFGATTTNTYDADGNQLTTTDPLGRTTTRTFDADGNELTVLDAAGGLVTRTYDAGGRVLTEQDALGRTTTNVYDARGNRIRTIDPAGGVQEITYDAFGNVVSITEPDGTTTITTYDALGRPVDTTTPDGVTTTTEFDAAGNPTAVEGPAVGGRQEFEVDGRGNPTRFTDATGAATQLALDHQGAPTSVVGPGGGGGLTQQLDAAGNPTALSLPDGTTRSFTYTPSGQLETETDGDGGVTTHTYDALDRRITTTWPDGTVSSTSYDLAGQVATETDRNGQVTTFSYDAAGRVASATDPTGGVTRYEYDLAGNRTALIDPVGGRTEYDYDTRNRLVRTEFPDGTTEERTYDAAGNLASITDQAGATTTFDHDRMGRLVAVTDPLGGVSTATYDEAGNQTSITDANGNTTRYDHDAANRLVATTFPTGVTETTTYNGQGLPVATTDRNGEVSTWTFDPTGRPLSRTGPDGETLSFGYDGTGGLVSATDASGTTGYTLNAMDRVTQIIHPDGSSLSYTNDAAGNRTSVTATLADGTARQTTYGYDAAGRMVTVTDHAGNTTTYGYDDAGRQTLLTRPNGTSTATTYDPMHRTTAITHAAGTTVLERFDYERNATGDPTRVTQADGSEASYVYDVVRRLIGETHTAGATLADRSYAYDAVSNRVEEVDALLGTTTESTYDADDRLLTAGSTTFVHDGRGAQLSISSGVGSTLYGYDDRGLLTSARLPDGTVVSYEVDVLGSRVDANGLSLLVDPFAPTGVPEVLVEHVGGQLTASYTYGTGLISVERGGATFYAHADEIGSVRLATDASGAVVATADYTAFGELLRSTGAMPWPHGFVGERRDANTGLYHLRARQYQPSTGLFTTVDPDVGTLDDPRSRHPYLYAEAAPLSYTDPTGRVSVGVVEISVVAAIAAGVSAAVFAPAATSIKERAQRAVVAAGLAALSTVAVVYLTGVAFAVVAGGLTAAVAGGAIGFWSALAVGITSVYAVYLSLSIFFGILSSCVGTAVFERKLCDLPSVVTSNVIVGVSTAGIGNRLPAGPIAQKVVEFILDVLPPFATDYLGGKLAPSS